MSNLQNIWYNIYGLDWHCFFEKYGYFQKYFFYILFYLINIKMGFIGYIRKFKCSLNLVKLKNFKNSSTACCTKNPFDCIIIAE